MRFLERLSPALENVDSSSGAIGTAVGAAIDALSEIIGAAPVEPARRTQLLARLWEALHADTIPYLDHLESCWGTCCGSPAAASAWIDEYVAILYRHIADGGRGYLRGQTAILSALYAAERYDELLAILEARPMRFWSDRRWGFQALVAQGRDADAIRYAEASRGINDFGGVDRACERVLLDRGFEEEAYRRYGMAAVPNLSTNLAIFRTMRKKYPRLDPATLLHDLATRVPGREGRWFAAAVSATLYDAALALARTSPADPKTLMRASRDRLDADPPFALAVAKLALESMALGYGFELSTADVHVAYRLGAEAARRLGTSAAYDTRVAEIATDAARDVRDALAFELRGDVPRPPKRR